MTDEKQPGETRKTEPQVIDLEPGDVRDETARDRDPDSTPEPQPVTDTPAEPEAQREPEEPAEAPAEPQREPDQDHPAEPELPPPPPPPPPSPPRKRKGVALLVASALVIGLAAGGWLYRDVLSNYWPTSQTTLLQERLDVLEARGRTADEQLLALSQKADEAARAAATAGEAAKAGAAALAGLSSRVDETEQQMKVASEALAAAKSDLDALRTAVSAGGTGGGTGTVDMAALAALGQRIDALEKDMASLKAADGDRSSLTAGLSQALSDLKAKIAAGTPFAAEYERIARMVPAAPGLDVLAAHAADGLPTAQGLATELEAAIPSLPQPETPAQTEGDGYWDSFVGLVSGIITIREIGETDWPELARQCVALAQAGDLSQAISLIGGAEGVKPQALNTWQDRAAARLRLEAALGQVSEAVVRQIAALGANP